MMQRKSVRAVRAVSVPCPCRAGSRERLTGSVYARGPPLSRAEPSRRGVTTGIAHTPAPRRAAPAAVGMNGRISVCREIIVSRLGADTVSPQAVIGEDGFNDGDGTSNVDKCLSLVLFL